MDHPMLTDPTVPIGLRHVFRAVEHGGPTIKADAAIVLSGGPVLLTKVWAAIGRGRSTHETRLALRVAIHILASAQATWERYGRPPDYDVDDERLTRDVDQAREEATTIAEGSRELARLGGTIAELPLTTPIGAALAEKMLTSQDGIVQEAINYFAALIRLIDEGERLAAQEKTP